ncbi:MAG: nucleoside recognition domain-containing protein [Verrucomicrobiota bacterium]
MLNYIWATLIIIGICVAGLLGRFGGEDGIIDGAFAMARIGVMNIALPLAAIMMIWLGVMRLAEKSGMIDLVARAVRPVMKWLFPDVPADHPAMGAMIMNMAANVLGLGNSATPLGLKAMQHLDDLNPNKGTASNAMCTFLAINTSSVTLIPVTAIALLSSAGIPDPYQIMGTVIGATLISTLVAIISVKLFEKVPVFRDKGASDVAAGEDGGGEGKDGEQGLRKIGLWGALILCAVLVATGFFVCIAAMPDFHQAVIDKLHLQGILDQLAAEKETLEHAEVAGEMPGWRRWMFAFSLTAIPFIWLFFIVYAWVRGVKVYEEFVEGAKEGFGVAVRIMPFLVTMLVALAIFRDSGALLVLQNVLRPLLDLVSFPVELVPMALMRPLSGSGSQGVLVEILTNEGIGDTLKYTAATMFGSTETTFYVLAVYFGSVGIRRTRHALAAGLCADAAGIIAAVVICKLVFG